MLDGQNIVVLDLETAQSVDDCYHCSLAFADHYDEGACVPWTGDRPSEDISQWSKIGWDDKSALGLSIGCFFDYQDGLFHWFDEAILEETMAKLVARQALIVTFNGRQFDLPLMWEVSESHCQGHGSDTDDFFGAWNALSAMSYDILYEIWRVDPARKFERGLNSLGVISQANGFGTKELDGAQAPRLWRQGRHAEVIQYNVSDVLKTKGLFEMICQGKPIMRGDGLPITLPVPVLVEAQLKAIAGQVLNWVHHQGEEGLP